MTYFPLLPDSTAPLLWHPDGRTTNRYDLLSQATQFAEQIADAEQVINLCEDYQAFMCVWLAALMNEQITILPSSAAPEGIQALEYTYPNAIAVSEDAAKHSAFQRHQTLRIDQQTANAANFQAQIIPAHQHIATVFTSGSTATPKACDKEWQALVCSAERVQARLSEYTMAKHVIATVPCQHLFGLEHAIMLTLQQQYSLCHQKPFYPEDLAQILEETSEPSILLTTPFHLQHFAESLSSLKPLRLIISSTGILDPKLAKKIENVFNVPVLDLYGSSETGAMATRRPAHSLNWQLLPYLNLTQTDQQAYLSKAEDPTPIAIGDDIECLDAEHFQLLKRQHSLIKIAGKRAHIPQLNAQLNAIPEVIEGIFFNPPKRHRNHRLCAFVVAKPEDFPTVQSKLRAKLDTAFWPRPLYLVEQLPYNELGKLTQHRLLTLWQQLNPNQRL